MYRSYHLFFLWTLFVAAMCLGFLGCAPERSSNQPKPVEAIEEIRDKFELPRLPLEFVKMTKMINSPSGDLEVAQYQDSEGRQYFVHPATNQVVEMDARAILSTIRDDAPVLSENELRAKATAYFQAVVPNFDQRQIEWRFEEGSKVDNYFFTWYDENQPVSFNRPFAQFAFHKSGIMFAYYNTLLLEP